MIFYLVVWGTENIYLFIYLFGVLRRFQHCTGDVTTGSWKGRGNQYIQFIRVLYCKLPTNGKQLPAFPLETVRGSNPGLRGGRRECYHSATVAPGTENKTSCYRDMRQSVSTVIQKKNLKHQHLINEKYSNTFWLKIARKYKILLLP